MDSHSEKKKGCTTVGSKGEELGEEREQERLTNRR